MNRLDSSGLDGAEFCDDSKGHSDFAKFRKNLDWLRKYELVQKNSAPWSW